MFHLKGSRIDRLQNRGVDKVFLYHDMGPRHFQRSRIAEDSIDLSYHLQNGNIRQQQKWNDSRRKLYAFLELIYSTLGLKMSILN